MPANSLCRSLTAASLVFLAVIAVKSSAHAVEDAQTTFTPLTEKSLERYVDPLIIMGEYLSPMQGLSLAGLRLYAFRDQEFVPIPFQVDETTEEGYKVLPDGPEGNPEMANHVLDPQDELLFMAFDSGDKVAFTASPLSCRQHIEIEVNDPLNNKKGWVYLLYFDSSPPPLSDKEPYSGSVELDHPTGYETVTDYYQIKGKQVEHRGKTYNQVFYKEFTIPKSAGSTGVDYVDRLKWRVKVGFLFNIIKVSFDEDSLIGNYICWQKGPIRGTYRAWASATLPMGLKSPRFVADIIGYDKIISTSTALNVPFNPGYVITEIVTRIGTDMSPEAKGMMFFNSENLEGFEVDGVMSKGEKRFDTTRDSWRILTGPQGTFMNRSVWDDSFIEQAESVEIEYVDDIGAPDAPEFHEGQIGHACSVAKLKKLKPGEYAVYIEWYAPPHFYDPQNPKKINMEVVNHYLNYQDNPLEFVIGDKKGVNRAKPIPAKKWK